MEASANTVVYPAAVPVDGAARPGAERAVPQLGLGRIIGVWAVAALPMGLLAWVLAPLIADQLSGSSALARALIVTLTVGLAWQFVLVMGLVAHEQRSLRWPVLRDALWLRAPRSPRTGRRGGRTWLVLIPLVAAFGVVELLPTVAPVAGRDLPAFLGSNAGEALFAGSWGWFTLLTASVVFNTVLGEELLFRGYLLPRMNGVFGRRDWLANGVLFAVYHLHIPWVIPSALIPIEAYAAKRYRSALVSIVVHSAQSIVILGLVLALVLAS